MKATERYSPVLLFIMQNNVVLTIESADEILWCDHSNESYWAVLSCGTFIMLYRVVLTFEFVDEILCCDRSNESYKGFFPVVLFIKIYKVVRIFESVDEIIILNELWNFCEFLWLKLSRLRTYPCSSCFNSRSSHWFIIIKICMCQKLGTS